MRRGLVAAAALALAASVGGGAAVLAQDKEAIVKDRQQFMKSQGAALGSVKAYLDGNAELGKAQEGAVQLASLAKQIPEKFPKGTGMAEFPGKSGAKPAIWTEWDKFLEHQKTLVSETEKLVDATKSGDKAKIAEQFANTGKNGCGGCHTPYREKLS
jgi:cytochrome c556